MDNLSLQLAIQQKGDELLIDARLLHQHLEVTTRFNDWIARRLADALAVEGKDFYSGLSKTQGRPSTEYALTLDLAKHVSMLERTERGKEIRDSFIAAEKELRNRPALPSYPEALRQLATTLEENEQLAQQNAVLTPKAEAFDALMESDGTYSVSNAAKILGLGLGGIKLFALLRERNILMDRKSSGKENHNVPYQKYLDAQYFKVDTKAAPDGVHVSRTTRVTTRGLAWLQTRLTAHLALPTPSGPPAQPHMA